MAERHVYIVRHGESNANTSGVDLGNDSLLTEKGYAQAFSIAKRISHIKGIETIVTSPLRRAVQTAEIISQTVGIPFQENKLFTQRLRPSCVKNKRHTDPEVRKVMKEIFLGYLIPGHRHSDEENLDEIKIRMKNALDFLKDNPFQHICVVTHGMILRALFCAVFSGTDFTGQDFQRAIQSLEPDNIGVTYIRVKDESNVLVPGEMESSWRLITWNDVAKFA